MKHSILLCGTYSKMASLELKTPLIGLLSPGEKQEPSPSMSKDAAPTDRELYQEIRGFGRNARGAAILSNGQSVGDFLLERWLDSDEKRKTRAKRKRKTCAPEE